MSEIPDWAAERIESARRQNATTLHLNPTLRGPGAQTRQRKEPLKAFPTAILDLANLRTLNLIGNDIEELPSEINRLSRLETLQVAYNRLTSLPPAMGELSHLNLLELWGNMFIEAPYIIASLSSLRTLGLGANPLEGIPPWMARLAELRSLNVSSAGPPYLSHLPQWMRTLHRLEVLHIRGHSLETLPVWLASLTKLRVLDLGNNSFTAIPDVIHNLSSLETLNFGNVDGTSGSLAGNYSTNNSIREITPEIIRLKHLKLLNFYSNPIETPPPEIASSDISEGLNIEAVRRYFVQLQREGTDFLNEAKLLILGEPGAGKTTLSRKILDPSYELRDEDSTRGIDIRLWKFEGGSGKPFRVNVWDFGGQEIYHSTHQFFLTKRSVYVLVADSRKEDTDLFYWLNVIGLLSDQSPAILVFNEKQDRFRNLDINALERQFPYLRAVARTNLATNRGFEEFLNAATNQIENLPHIGTPLPQTWVSVRLALETDERSWISAEEFDAICARHGFSSAKEQRQLSGFLHDLGVILHFHADPLLKRVVILRPEWGTGAVYRIFDDPEVLTAGGRFTHIDIQRVWSDSQYYGMHDELLRLMLNFKLCYSVPGEKGTYIAPQLLPASPPVYTWNNSRNLIVKYVYDFMPKGLLSQLIVSLHDLVEDQSLAWRSGAVFRRDQTRAEVVEHYNLRQVQVRVYGPFKRELLGLISRAMELIHRSYGHIKVQELIPCFCEYCQASEDVEYYQLRQLRKFLDDNQESIQCRNGYGYISVRQLLAEVELPSSADASIASPSGVIVHGSVDKLIVAHSAGTVSLTTTDPPDRREHVLRRGSVPLPKSNAWANGSFYLTTSITLLAAIGVLATKLSVVALPIVLIAGILFTSVVGALQLRQDKRLAEKSFIELMGLTLKALPVLAPPADEAEQDEKE